MILWMVVGERASFSYPLSEGEREDLLIPATGLVGKLEVAIMELELSVFPKFLATAMGLDLLVKLQSLSKGLETDWKWELKL